MLPESVKILMGFSQSAATPFREQFPIAICDAFSCRSLMAELSSGLIYSKNSNFIFFLNLDSFFENLIHRTV